MNIRDVVKNTDSFCGSRPADGATSYYAIRLCNLTPNGLLPPCNTLTLTLPLSAPRFKKKKTKRMIFKKSSGKQNSGKIYVYQWYVCFFFNAMQFILE